MNAIALQYNDNISVNFTNDAWFNATEVASSFGKRPIDWLNLESTQQYISDLCEIFKCEESSLLKTKRGRHDGGSWFSPKLSVPFARWLDSKFAIWCDMQIDNILHTQPQNHQLPEPPTRTAITGCLTRDQQDVIKALVKERAEALPKEMQAGATIRCWSAIKKKFGCSYKEVPSDNFVNVISLLSRLPLEGELLAPPAPEQMLSRSEVEAMINERLKAPAIPAKLPHTGQTLGFNIEANLKLDGLIDGLERYGYRIIRIRNDAGLLS